MDWFLYLLIGWMALNALTTIVMIGKPRTPTTPVVAAAVVAIDALLIIGLIATLQAG